MPALIFRRIALGAAVVLLAGCSSLNPFASNKPKFAPLAEFTPKAQLASRWQVSLGEAKGYAFQPAVAAGAVFAAANNGEVLRVEEGQIVWRTKLEHKLSAGVGSDGRLAVVATEQGEVVALNAYTGEVRWSVPINAQVLAPPAVDGEIVAVRTADNRLIGLSASDGARRWVVQRSLPPLALRNFAGVLVREGVAVMGFPGGKLAAINLANGGELWELTVALARGATELERVADVAGLPVLAGRALCAASYQGRVACFNPANGSTLWSKPFSTSVGLDHDGRQLFATDADDAVHGMEVSSGSSLWKADGFRLRQLTRPALLDRYVAVGDREGYVHLLDRDDGSLAARQRIDSSAIIAAPVQLGRALVVQTQGGSLHALEVR